MWLASRHRFVVVNLRFAVPPPRGCTVGNLFGGAQAEELKSPDRLVRGRRPTGRGGVGGQQGGSSAGVPRGPRRCAVRPYWLLHSRNTSVAPPLRWAWPLRWVWLYSTGFPGHGFRCRRWPTPVGLCPIGGSTGALRGNTRR